LIGKEKVDDMKREAHVLERSVPTFGSPFLWMAKNQVDDIRERAAHVLERSVLSFT
jgi:hypothetical protein